MKILNELSKPLQVAVIIVGFLTPGIAFYAATRVSLAQQELRLASAERRLDKLEATIAEVPKLIEDRFEKIVVKLDKQDDKLGNVEKSIVRIQEQIANGRSR